MIMKVNEMSFAMITKLNFEYRFTFVEGGSSNIKHMELIKIKMKHATSFSSYIKNNEIRPSIEMQQQKTFVTNLNKLN